MNPSLLQGTNAGPAAPWTPAPLAGHDRFAYQPITGRADYAWPNGARLAVYLGFNIEHFAFGEGLGAELGPASPHPDVLNYAWREYGNRVGAWRCLELFDALGLPAGALINTALYDHCPELVDACLARGDELIGHGYSNAHRQGGGWAKRRNGRCWNTAATASAATPAAPRPAGCRRGFRKAAPRRTCWPRLATATP